MKIGYSLILRELIKAEEIDYEDCKIFQIVCPECKEPIYKVSRSSSTDFLSHYRKDETLNTQCELRVETISKSDVLNSRKESRGQKLVYFLEVFKDIVFENEYGEYKNDSKMKKIFYSIHFSKIIMEIKLKMFNSFRDNFYNQNKTDVLEMFDEYIEDIKRVSDGSFFQTSFSINLRKEFAYDLLMHLLSGHGKQNYYFLLSHAYLFLLDRIEQSEKQRQLYEWEALMHEYMVRLIRTTNKKKGLKIIEKMCEYPLSPPFTAEESDMFVKVLSEIQHEALGVLLRLPYYELIKERMSK